MSSLLGPNTPQKKNRFMQGGNVQRLGVLFQNLIYASILVETFSNSKFYDENVKNAFLKQKNDLRELCRKFPEVFNFDAKKFEIALNKAAKNGEIDKELFAALKEARFEEDFEQGMKIVRDQFNVNNSILEVRKLKEDLDSNNPKKRKEAAEKLDEVKKSIDYYIKLNFDRTFNPIPKIESDQKPAVKVEPVRGQLSEAQKAQYNASEAAKAGAAAKQNVQPKLAPGQLSEAQKALYNNAAQPVIAKPPIIHQAQAILKKTPPKPPEVPPTTRPRGRGVF